MLCKEFRDILTNNNRKFIKEMSQETKKGSNKKLKCHYFYCVGPNVVYNKPDSFREWCIFWDQITLDFLDILDILDFAISLFIYCENLKKNSLLYK